MREQVKRVLEAQTEVNINFRVPEVKRNAFKGWCAENEVTMSGMLISFMDDCIMLGKVFKTKESGK